MTCCAQYGLRTTTSCCCWGQSSCKNTKLHRQAWACMACSWCWFACPAVALMPHRANLLHMRAISADSTSHSSKAPSKARAACTTTPNSSGSGVARLCAACLRTVKMGAQQHSSIIACRVRQTTCGSNRHTTTAVLRQRSRQRIGSVIQQKRLFAAHNDSPVQLTTPAAGRAAQLTRGSMPLAQQQSQLRSWRPLRCQWSRRCR